MEEQTVAQPGSKKNAGKLTALFAVRRWLRETPCSAAQAQVLFALASFAQPDGTNVHPGIDVLSEITKLDRSTIIDALKVWRSEAVGAIARTKCGDRRSGKADEYQINLDWQPSKVGQDDFCKSRSERPMGVHKSDTKRHKSDRTGQKSSRTTPSEKTLALKEKPNIETSSSEAKPDDDDDDVLKEKMERLRRQHPSFVEACERIVLDRASAMGKRVASTDRYFAGALPSLMQEPRLVVEIAFALNLRNLSEAQALYDAAVETFIKEPPAPPPFPDFKSLTPWQRARSFWLLADFHGLIGRNYDQKAVKKLLRRNFGSHNVQSFDEATYRRAWTLLNQQPEVVH